MTPNPPLLVLWDIDGTLIDNGGLMKQVHARVYEQLAGTPPTERVITEGMTDIAIMRSLLDRHGIEVTPAVVARIPTLMAQTLAAMANQLTERGQAMPGARSAIDAIAALPGVTQSVLTGNIAQNALLKLSAYGLDSGLDMEIAAYGSDDEVRTNLVAVARLKAWRKHNIAFDSASTVLIGDTPRDVEAGRVGGAHVIAVASGVFTEDELTAEGADVVLPDLRDTDRLVSSLLSLRHLPRPV